MTRIDIAGLSKHYGDVRAVDNVSLTIAPGEFIVLVGPSGCGKTTLLRMLAGLTEPTAGRITFDGRDVTQLHPGQRNVAMVFQNYALFPHMTVERNLGFGLRLRRVRSTERDARIAEVAQILRITELLARYPRELSGGQKQRVALGRALIRQPVAFLFDEPLSNLDQALRVEMRAEIAQLHRKYGITTVYVTHDQVEAMTMGDRIAVMNAGRLTQVGAPGDVYHDPRDLFTAGFIGSPSMNLLPGVLAQDGGRLVFSGAGGVRFDAGPVHAGGTRARDADYAGEVVAGFRPEHVRIALRGRAQSRPADEEGGRDESRSSSAGVAPAIKDGGRDARPTETMGGDTAPPLLEVGGIAAQVVLVEQLGREYIVHMQAGATKLSAVATAGAPPEQGDTVTAIPDPAKLYLFDAATGARLN